MSVQSPGGSLYPYYYKNGELHALKFGSFDHAEQRLFQVMRQERGFILAQHRMLNIWVDFYQTTITSTVIVAFIENLMAFHHSIRKLALVGLSLTARLKMKLAIAQIPSLRHVPIRYFVDPEDAKTWIVQENP